MFECHEHAPLCFAGDWCQPVYRGGGGTLAGLLSPFFRDGGFGFVSVFDSGFCGSVHSVVREAHGDEGCPVVGRVESLVSWCSIFMFTRAVMKRHEVRGCAVPGSKR